MRRTLPSGWRWVAPAAAALSLVAASAALATPRAAPVVSLGSGAKQATVATVVPAGRSQIVVTLKISPGQSLGVLARNAKGRLYSARTFSGCKGSPKTLTCGYEIPVPALGRYTVVLSRAAGPPLKIAYTITFA